MSISDNPPLTMKVFMPFALEEIAKVERNKLRFVHYTSAEVASKIIEHSEIWMRKSSVMNDFSEVEYGANCIRHAFSSPAGRRFEALLEQLVPGGYAELNSRITNAGPKLVIDTYLTCLSVHNDFEDQLGRLSMWRAYGGSSGVALVVNNQALLSESNALHAYSSPVAYLTPTEFGERLLQICELVEANLDGLKALPRDQIQNATYSMLHYAMLCTKHPGFKEEREWRIIYNPSVDSSTRIKKQIRTVHGIPQPVCLLPLADVPEQGFYGASLPSLVDSVIIGPSRHPYATYEAFVELLANANISDASSRVKLSTIPLRT